MPKTKKKTSKRKPNPAFMRPVQPDDKLAAIVGSQPLPRTELTKKLWNYIKRHGCQDKKKRTMINADDSLRRGIQWQEPGEHVRDDKTRLETPALDAALTFKIALHELR